MARRSVRPQSPPPPKSVRGIDEARFLAWRSHPVTVMFRRYLLDFKEQKIKDATTAMVALTLTEKDQITLAGLIPFMEDMADPTFAMIRQFYDTRDDAEEAEARERAEKIPPDLRDLPALEEDDDDAAETATDRGGALSD